MDGVTLPGATQAALRALLLKFASRVRSQIESHRLSAHGIDPDDVEQEVHIRLWRALERDPNAVLPASYIQRVVLSVLVDAVRRAEVRAADPLPEAEEGEAQPALPASDRPDRRASDAERVRMLMDAIADIPLRRRQPLQLYLQGHTLPEVAGLCRLTEDAARKLVYRGLDEVRARLRANGVEVEDE